ncbi:hypothetical protein J2R99_000366 [Rhodopseudomonas julia]|uniref:Phage tail protein n=1 Tax=Rhodopseudomonas julia TaxID=200617 RepID=A0ABU0C606_9BRAD|nr:glycoside hydrolase/phage tail family protein [Rhodopseudomonas julia]MDQ0324517.1 hypothetical protein [Rhodopseudomonas julia]
MATLLLSAAGASLGGLFGGVGAIAGRALGALAGYAIDRSVFSTERKAEGARLSDLTVQSSTEGAPIPRVYGRVRLAGQVIWATDFEEVATTDTQRAGGKGGGSKVTTTTYSYFANFAVALCEGEVAHIGRIWADGKPLDPSLVTLRIYKGSEDQLPDPLIAAHEIDPPAYRGTAYVVFERLALAEFGNRIPQLSFEILRPVGSIEKDIRAVCVIPGAGEFVYDTALRLSEGDPGTYATANTFARREEADFETSLDELMDLCPRLEWVTLVVAWFGNDLRAPECLIQPMVDDAHKRISGGDWSVAGLTRGEAEVVSYIDGRAAYGGTPSDETVIRAIRELTARGLKVALLPFVLMDVAEDNELPDPRSGEAGQPPYPWRGRITLTVAPGRAGSPDKSAAAAGEITDFLGEASLGQFSVGAGGVFYSGPTEWRYRRFILHNAHLAKAAGGVDAFLVGSEMVALSQIRGQGNRYPFVEALRVLRGECRQVLGPATKISYAADWSEYFGHQPADGSGDVFFHLDPFWAEADFVGIDIYWPLADWRDEPGHADEAAGRSIHRCDYLRKNLAAGEGFDWYYASDEDRKAQRRSRVTDGTAGKPWVFRFKDIESWWKNRHYDRPGGMEQATPTPWVPFSKPIWFTEFGCPAVDKGANQPNVFYDPKSSEGALPHFSAGERDDLIQRRTIEALLSAYDPSHGEYAGMNRDGPNGFLMVDPAHLTLWTWDARPYPWFPALEDVWGDAPNWRFGHWLNGRLGAMDLARLIEAVLSDHGFDAAEVADVHGLVEGFVVSDRTSARATLEPLLSAYGVDAADAGTKIRFRGRARPLDASLSDTLLIDATDAPLTTRKRAQETELAAEVALRTLSPDNDYRMAAAHSRRLAGRSRRVLTLDLPIVARDAEAETLAEAMLADLWRGREEISFVLPPSFSALDAGDAIRLTLEGRSDTFLVTRIADGEAREVEARRVTLRRKAMVPATPTPPGIVTPPAYGPPLVHAMELPAPADGEKAHQPRLAAFAEPWPGTLAVYRGEAGGGFSFLSTIATRATCGRLATALRPGPLGRFDRANAPEVMLYGGALASLPEIDVLAGGNLAAVKADDGSWEILQFATAELIATRRYRLSLLLRGQGGSETAMAAGARAGNAFVLLNDAVAVLPMGLDAIGREQRLRIGPIAESHAAASFVEIAVTPEGRGLRPASPVHLRARRVSATGDVALSWTRRTRFGGDSWALAEVPLNETREAYRVEILDGGTVRREAETGSASFAYAAADQLADFGALPEVLSVRVAQLSETIGPGFAAEATLRL